MSIPEVLFFGSPLIAWALDAGCELIGRSGGDR